MSVPEKVFFPQTVDPLNTACLLWYKESTVSVDAGMRLQLLIRLRFSIPMQLHGDRVNHCVRNDSLEYIREIEKQSEHTRPQCHSAQHKCSTAPESTKQV